MKEVKRKMKKEPLYAVVDIETTGPKFEEGDRIIQFGCTLVEEGEIKATYSFDICPNRSIPESIQQLTGITNEQVASAPLFEDVGPFIYSILEGAIFVAHNIQFDYPFLVRSLRELVGIEYEALQMDTVQLAQLILPTQESYRLSDLTQALCIDHEESHTAGSDSLATASLFLLLQEHIKELPIQTLEAILTFSPFLQAETGLLFEHVYHEMKYKKTSKKNHEWIEIGGLVLKKPRTAHASTLQYEPIETALNGYHTLCQYTKRTFRPEQEHMIRVLDTVFQQEEKWSFIEAPAGTGKTLSYVLHALLHATVDKPIWIATSTLLLQQQLYRQEVLPLLNWIAPHQTIVSLKGRYHYLNLASFLSMLQDDVLCYQPRGACLAIGLLIWLTQTETGDLDECNSVVVPSELRKYVNGDYDWGREDLHILFKDVNFYDVLCHNASTASIVITNHAYIYQLLQQESSLISQKQPVLILDECHQMEKTIRQATTVEFSLYPLYIAVQQLTDMFEVFMDETENEENVPVWMYTLDMTLQFLGNQYQEFENNISEYPFHEELGHYAVLSVKEWLGSDLFQYAATIYEYVELLEKYLREKQEEWTLSSVYVEMTEDGVKHYVARILQQLHSIREQFALFFDFSEHDYIAIQLLDPEVERDIVLTKLPIELDGEGLFKHFSKVIGVSATVPKSSLLFNESRIARTLHEIEWVNPLHRNNRIFIPANLVMTNQTNKEEYLSSMAAAIEQLYAIRKGRMLVLVHSQEALTTLFTLLSKKKRKDWMILAQSITGSAKKVQKRFERLGEALVLGLYSFWEGYDAGEERIDTLVITKLPFANPMSVEQLAFEAYYQRKKQHYFSSVALPHMLERLRQGMGRLLRNEHSKGVTWLLDSRIVHRSYSQQVLKALPPQSEVYIDTFQHCIEKMQQENNENEK